MDWAKLIDIGSKISLASVLILAIMGNLAGYWVSGMTHKEMTSDRDAWKQLALQGAKLAVTASNQTIAGMNAPVAAPLPPSSDRKSVERVLREVGERVQYASDPTE